MGITTVSLHCPLLNHILQRHITSTLATIDLINLVTNHRICNNSHLCIGRMALLYRNNVNIQFFYLFSQNVNSFALCSNSNTFPYLKTMKKPYLYKPGIFLF